MATRTIKIEKLDRLTARISASAVAKRGDVSVTVSGEAITVVRLDGQRGAWDCSGAIKSLNEALQGHGLNAATIAAANWLTKKVIVDVEPAVRLDGQVRKSVTTRAQTMAKVMGLKGNEQAGEGKAISAAALAASAHESVRVHDRNPDGRRSADVTPNSDRQAWLAMANRAIAETMNRYAQGGIAFTVPGFRADVNLFMREHDQLAYLGAFENYVGQPAIMYFSKDEIVDPTRRSFQHRVRSYVQSINEKNGVAPLVSGKPLAIDFAAEYPNQPVLVDPVKKPSEQVSKGEYVRPTDAMRAMGSDYRADAKNIFGQLASETINDIGLAAGNTRLLAELAMRLGCAVSARTDGQTAEFFENNLKTFGIELDGRFNTVSASFRGKALSLPGQLAMAQAS